MKSSGKQKKIKRESNTTSIQQNYCLVCDGREGPTRPAAQPASMFTFFDFWNDLN